MGLMVGLISVGIYVIQCVGMYYGGYLIFENEINPRTGEPFTGADVITVYFALVMGVMGKFNKTISFNKNLCTKQVRIKFSKYFI